MDVAADRGPLGPTTHVRDTLAPDGTWMNAADPAVTRVRCGTIEIHSQLASGPIRDGREPWSMKTRDDDRIGVTGRAIDRAGAGKCGEFPQEARLQLGPGAARRRAAARSREPSARRSLLHHRHLAAVHAGLARHLDTAVHGQGHSLAGHAVAIGSRDGGAGLRMSWLLAAACATEGPAPAAIGAGGRRTTVTRSAPLEGLPGDVRRFGSLQPGLPLHPSHWPRACRLPSGRRRGSLLKR